MITVAGFGTQMDLPSFPAKILQKSFQFKNIFRDQDRIQECV